MLPDLSAKAAAARENAIAPYSGFKVGAALQTTQGEIYTGCNVENASFGLSMCAERIALWKALSEGVREFEFRRIAIVTDTTEPTPPCGACRQLLWEYCGDITIHLETLNGRSEEYRLAQLLPHPFDRFERTK